MKTLGERAKYVCRKQSLTSTYLAKEIGVSQSTISFYFSNRSFPNESFFLRLKKLIPQLSLDWLITGSGEMFLDGEGVDTKEVERLKEEVESLRASQRVLIRTMGRLSEEEEKSAGKSFKLGVYQMGNLLQVLELRGNQPAS